MGRAPVIALYAFLACFTIAAFIALAGLSASFPVLFGLGTLAYVLGLRHGVDADHILAIDNTTRKLMHEGKKPIANGLFFSLGHSTIVFIMVMLVVIASQSIFNYFYNAKSLLGAIGTVISAAFLCIMAVINLVILLDMRREYAKSKAGKMAKEALPAGFLSRIYSRLFKSIHSSWQLYPIGVLFGLGFDTATEVTLIGISAAEAGTIPLAYLLILPTMFAAGMTLVDSTDSVFMVRAYGWALADTTKRIFYNMVITGVSVITAFAVAAIEALQLFPSFFPAIESFDINAIGFGILSIFVTIWLGAKILGKRRA